MASGLQPIAVHPHESSLKIVLVHNKHGHMAKWHFSHSGLSCNMFSGQLRSAVPVTLGMKDGRFLGYHSIWYNVHNPTFVTFDVLSPEAKLCSIVDERRRRFWHATHDCVAPYVDIVLHRGRF